jgi:hypothetical protein
MQMLIRQSRTYLWLYKRGGSKAYLSLAKDCIGQAMRINRERTGTIVYPYKKAC